MGIVPFWAIFFIEDFFKSNQSRQKLKVTVQSNVPILLRINFLWLNMVNFIILIKGEMDLKTTIDILWLIMR